MDLSSSKGTYMEGQKLEPHKPYLWKPGVTVVLGIPKCHDKATLRILDSSSSSGSRKRSIEAGAEEPPAKRSQCARPSVAENGKPAGASTKCDKCDGPHATAACPHFKKAREDHKDAWANYGNKKPQLGQDKGVKFVLRRGREVAQPGDGSCLFHSLCF